MRIAPRGNRRVSISRMKLIQSRYGARDVNESKFFRKLDAAFGARSSAE